MASKDNVKYLAVACDLQKTVISDYYIDEQNRIFSEDYLGTLKEIMATPNIEPNAANSLVSPLGNWVYLLDDNNYAFVALTSAQYPPRVLGNLLLEMKKELYEVHPTAGTTRLTPEEGNKEFLSRIARKYMYPSEYAGVANGREANLHDFQIKIQESLRQSVENTVKPTTTEVHAVSTQEVVDTEKRKLILKGIFWCFVVSIALYIIVPIIAALSS